MPERKIWAEGGKISTHVFQFSSKSYCTTLPGEMHFPRNEERWWLLAIFLNRFPQPHCKKGCTKEAGCSNIHDRRDLVKQGQTRYLDWSIPFPLGRWFSHMGLLRLGFPWLILLFRQFNNSIFGLLQFCSFLCWPLVSPSHLKSGEHTVSQYSSAVPRQQVTFTDINLVPIR